MLTYETISYQKIASCAELTSDEVRTILKYALGKFYQNAVTDYTLEQLNEINTLCVSYLTHSRSYGVKLYKACGIYKITMNIGSIWLRPIREYSDLADDSISVYLCLDNYGVDILITQKELTSLGL